MKTLLAHILLPLRNPRFWGLVGIILLGRMGYFAYWGVLLEIDSLGYLELQAAVYHPPGYMVFNAAALAVVDSLEAIVVAQSLLYGFAAAIFLWRWVPKGRLQLGLAIALAVEPLSGKLACTIMAETLFLALLLLALAWLALVQAPEARRWTIGAIMVGLLLGLAYVTRYAAPVFLVALLLWLLGRRLPWRQVAVAALLMGLGYQAAILPLRLYYEANFGTLRFNAFSSLSLWNSTAYLYPASDARSDPRGGFEQRLVALPAATFAIDETWHTNQMFHDSSAFQRHVRGMGTAATLEAGREAGSLGLRLLRADPLRHLHTFVIPNFLRPFIKTDLIYADRLPPLIAHGLVYQPFPLHRYDPIGWWLCCGGLLVATIGYAVRRKQLPAIVPALLLSCWLYWAGIAVLTVIFLRFLFVMAPLVVVALGLVAGRENPPRSAQ
jgi:hypothetical protein